MKQTIEWFNPKNKLPQIGIPIIVVSEDEDGEDFDRATFWDKPSFYSEFGERIDQRNIFIDRDGFQITNVKRWCMIL